MKRRNRRASSFLLFFGLAILLQSCFVWEAATYWRSIGAGSSAAIARQQPGLEIRKGQGFFLFPFLFITYGVGGYHIDFTVYNEKAFNGVDSIRYNILTKNRRLYSHLVVPKVYYFNAKGRAKDLKKKVKADTINRVFWSTQLRGFVIAKRTDSVRVNFDVFIKDSSGAAQVIKYNNCQLMREGSKFGSLL